MGVNLGFVTGVMLGMELHEDENFDYFILDLLIIRLIFFIEKNNENT